MRIEMAWGRMRRFLLRKLRPGYVRQMQGQRQGDCPNCPHDIIDSRDLKYFRNVCGYSFKPEDDRFAWRDRLRMARYGLGELLLFSLLLFGLSFLNGWLAVLLQDQKHQKHWVFWFVQTLIGLTWLEIVWFFRDPERAIPQDAMALVSPADGTITNVEEVDEPDFPGGRALRISIFLSIFNVHVNRLPCSGRVVQVRYFPGAFLDARNPKCAVRNEQLWIDMEEAGSGGRIRVKQISGAIARRIVCWLKAGDEFNKGDRLGMIKLGSRTDLLVQPGPGWEVCVKIGDKVRGGSTILLRAGRAGV
jgi:phosphatidylserine decarboxylase